MANEAETQEAGWPLRTWVLMGLGALFALAIQQLADLPDSGWDWGKRLVLAACIFLGTSGVAFGLSWRRGRHVPAGIVAAICGAIAGGVTLWNGISPDFFVVWPFCAGFVSAAVLLVLFQAADARHPHLPRRWSWAGIKDWKREALVYSDVHEAAWTDALLGLISGIFTGIVMAIAFLLAEMFHLVKIDLLRDLLRKEWIDALIIGGAYGGGMGLLRDRATIISALQRVAMIVLRVLAPVLAVGLVAFLAVLPFTGLAPLWGTGETTPSMLAAALVALFLVNAVIGDKAEDVSNSRALRWGAMALGLALLPLALIAAWSTGLRIGQYGLSPDRLWALTFIILGTVTAVAYVAAIARKGDWVTRLYRSNLHLAFILGGVAFILSTSLISFERISTADQIARLESGKIKPIDFDYRGLWFDFGPPGKAAIKRMAKSSNADVRKYAVAIQKEDYRYGAPLNEMEKRRGDDLDKRLTILPVKVPLEEKLRARLTDYDVCGSTGKCELRYVPGQDYAIAVSPPDKDCKTCQSSISVLYRGDKGEWAGTGEVLNAVVGAPAATTKIETATARARNNADAIRTGKVEMRTVQRRQLFIDGKPFGEPIPMENAAEP
ncbi:MAG: DUF4153 domain-containing protein [Sphingobium sp.]|nr:DUF4153 domain-containing protein [Sphingobium sp.]